MIVKSILAGKRGDVVTIEPTANLTAAAKLLAEQRIGAVVTSAPIIASSASCRNAILCARSPSVDRQH